MDIKSIKNGLFIVIEGGEGSGKTTLTKSLENEYCKRYLTVTTREPGGSDEAEKIRDIAINGNINEISQLLLFAASRSINTRNIIKPYLDTNCIVICDRYALSSMVYQGVVQGIDVEKIINLMDLACENVKPDIEIVLDIDAKTGIERVMTNNREINEMDKKGLEFHNKVNKAYRTMTYMAPYRIIIDANDTPDNILKKCITFIDMVISFKELDSSQTN